MIKDLTSGLIDKFSVEFNTSENKILLHTNMDTGHGGASGRFESLKEIALDYAFFIGLENKTIK